MTELVTGKAFPYVVVTGIAMTTALATDAETTWKLLLDRQSGIRTLDDPFVEEFDLPVRIGGHLLEEFDHQLTRIELRRMGYLQRMSTVLSRRLWENAGSPEVDTNRLMVSIGTGLGSAEELVFSYDDMRARGMKAVSPLTVQKYMPNGRRGGRVGTARQGRGDDAGIGVRIRRRGHRPCVAADCAGRGRCRHLRRRGDQDRSGAHRRVRSDAHRDVHQQRRPRRCMPPIRQGPRRLCVRRGRRPSVDRDRGARQGTWRQHPGPDHGRQHHLRWLPHGGPDPNGERAGHAITRAIQLAGLAPGDIDHVNAHATGTQVGDLAEGRAINNALGGNRPAVYAPKSALGHSVGAVGAVESILTVLALRDQVIPPTLNLVNLDPEIDLDVVAGEPRPGNYRYAINNSFGFGGHNVAIAFGRY